MRCLGHCRVRRPIKAGHTSTNARTDEVVEQRRERKLHRSDVPFQNSKLFARAARTKHECAFARVQRIGFRVHDVIDAIKHKPEWKEHEK